MPTFSNTNDKIAITAINDKILFFLMKSIMNINNLFIKFLYRIINNLNHYINYDGANIFRIFISLIASCEKIIEKYYKGIKEWGFYEEPTGRDFNYPNW